MSAIKKKIVKKVSVAKSTKKVVKSNSKKNK